MMREQLCDTSGPQDKIVGGFTATEMHTDGAWGTAASTQGLGLPPALRPMKDMEHSNHGHCCRQHCSLCVPVILTEPTCTEAGQMNLGLTGSCGNRSPWAPPCFSPGWGAQRSQDSLAPEALDLQRFQEHQVPCWQPSRTMPSGQGRDRQAHRTAQHAGRAARPSQEPRPGASGQ